MSEADAAGCSRRSSSGTLDCAASSSTCLTSSRTLGRSSTRQAWATAASSSEGASSTRCPRAATLTSCAASSRASRMIRRLPSSRAAVARWRRVRASCSWSDTSARIPTGRCRFFSLTWRCSSTSGGGSARRTSMRPSWRAAVFGSPEPPWGGFPEAMGHHLIEGQARLVSAPEEATMATTLATWTIDPVHPSVEFSLEYVGFSMYRTAFRALEGSLEFDAARPAASSVNASMPAASVDVTNDRLMSRLMDPDLLGGRDHPTITFKSTRVEALDPAHSRVTGDLAIHGVAQPVVLCGRRAISARPSTRSAARSPRPSGRRRRWREEAPAGVARAAVATLSYGHLLWANAMPSWTRRSSGEREIRPATFACRGRRAGYCSRPWSRSARAWAECSSWMRSTRRCFLNRPRWVACEPKTARIKPGRHRTVGTTSAVLASVRHAPLVVMPVRTGSYSLRSAVPANDVFTPKP